MSDGHDDSASQRVSPLILGSVYADNGPLVPKEGLSVNAPIELICDAHLAHDPVGPLVTLIDRRWAYCASHAEDGHEWRRIAPIERDLLDATTDLVRSVCDDRRHLEIGRAVPQGDGMLTLADGKWAYCTASLDEPHHWVQVDPVDLHAIDHVDLADRLEGRS